MNIFNILFFKPILNLLIFCYNVFPIKDIGFSIIIVTFFIKILIFPLSLMAKRYQEKMALLQPKVDALQKKIKEAKNPEEQKKTYQEFLNLYKEEKINPLSSILPTILQFVILIALFLVVNNFFISKDIAKDLYPWVGNPLEINFKFLNTIDLAKPNVFLAVLAAIFQFFQTKLSLPKIAGKKDDIINIFNFQILYIFPLLTFFVLLKLRSIFGLYWLTMSILSIFEEKYLFPRFIKANKTYGRKPTEN